MVAQRVAVMTDVMRDEAIQDIATLRRTSLDVFTRTRGRGRSGAMCRLWACVSALGTLCADHLWRQRTDATSSRSPSDESEDFRHGTLLNYFGCFSAGPFIPGYASKGKRIYSKAALNRQLGRVTRSIRVAPQKRIIRSANCGTRTAPRFDTLSPLAAGLER